MDGKCRVDDSELDYGGHVRIGQRKVPYLGEHVIVTICTSTHVTNLGRANLTARSEYIYRVVNNHKATDVM